MSISIANHLSKVTKAGAIAAGLALALSGCTQAAPASSSAAGATTSAAASTSEAKGASAGFAADMETFKKNLPTAVNGMTKDSDEATAVSYDALFSDIKGNKVHIILCEKATDTACSGATTKKEWKGHTVALTSNKPEQLAIDAERIFGDVVPK